MKLGLKLFLIVGALLAIICAAVYFIPIWVAETQDAEDRDTYFALLNKQREQVWQSQQNWLISGIANIEGEVDAFLYLTANNPDLPKILESPGVWLLGTQLLRYNEPMDLLQVVRDKKETAVIAFPEAQHYWAQEERISDTSSWLYFDSREWKEPYTWQRPQEPPEELVQHVFFGIRLPKMERAKPTNVIFESAKPDGSFLLLFDPVELYTGRYDYAKMLEKNREAIDAISVPELTYAPKIFTYLLEELAAAEAYLQKQFTSEKALLAFIEKKKEASKTTVTEYPLTQGLQTDSAGEIYRQDFFSEYVYTNLSDQLVSLTTAMAFFASFGIVWESPLDASAAKAAAYVPLGRTQGGGAFAKDIFAIDPAFNPEKLFATYPMVKGPYQMSSGFGLIGDLVTNSMKLDDGTLTVSSTLRPVFRAFYNLTGGYLFMVQDGKVIHWEGIEWNDTETRDRFFNVIEQNMALFGEKMGFVNLDGKRYFYSHYRPVKSWDLTFVRLELASNVIKPLQIFEKKRAELMHMLTSHMLVFAFAILAVALIGLHLIIRRFTRPIATLATATEHVAEGRYDDVELPKVSETSQDEIAVLTHAFGRMVRGLKDRRKIRSVLDKVVSKEVAEEILQGKVHLGGEEREACVLFADLFRFTELSQSMTPQQTLAFLNSYMNRMTRVIEAHRGVIDKYIGDEIMALFGAPVTYGQMAIRAVVTALQMIEELNTWNRERHGELIVEAGIGINVGEMVAGNVGAEDRLNYTVMGTNVNLAARLCAEAGPMEILLPEETAKSVEQYVRTEMRSTIRLKGFSEPIEIYRVIGLQPGYSLDQLSEMLR